MNYYFDVKLNFLNNLYNYYEWDEKDNIMDVKKIPLIKVSFQDFIKIFSNKIKVNDEFLDKIRNKTIIKNGLIEYAVIFTDSNNSIGVLFNEKGESILYSALSFNDEFNIEEMGFKLKKEKIDFDTLNKKEFNKMLRFENEILNTIKSEINNLIKTKNYSKLKYIYNDIYKINEKDIDIIIKNLSNLKEKEFLNFYDIIKYTKKNV